MLGAGALRVQDRARPERQREIHAISQAVSEKQFRSREGHIIGAQSENALRVIASRDEHVAVAMHCRLRGSAAAGSVKHESRIG